MFDLIASFLGLIVLSPLLLGIAIWIKIDSPGPVIYAGRRVGRFGREFRLYKFRTMVPDADKIGGSSTADGDPRLTRSGRFLRRFKLDELPQLFNALSGRMSLVGPRPEVEQYTSLFNEEEKMILSVRPGITDWASIWNSDEGAVLAGAEDPDRAYEELIRPTKLKLQMKYVRERSFWIDLKIIFLTFLAVVSPESKAVREIRAASGPESEMTGR